MVEGASKWSACRSVDWYFPVDPVQTLPALVETYNPLGNPGRFQLRALSRDSFDVVWNGVSSVPTVPCSAGGRWPSKRLSSAGRVRLLSRRNTSHRSGRLVAMTCGGGRGGVANVEVDATTPLLWGYYVEMITPCVAGVN